MWKFESAVGGVPDFIFTDSMNWKHKDAGYSSITISDTDLLLIETDCLQILNIVNLCFFHQI